MAEWLFERGIGEDRAVLVEQGEIVEAAIELPAALRAGAVLAARLTAILVPGKRGIVKMVSGDEALLEPLPRGITEGGSLHVEVVREAIAEADRLKLARVRATDAPLSPGPSLAERIGSHRLPVPGGPDLFEAAGWSELIESAISGEIPFHGGALRMSLTPAMTLFDVDGALESAALAVAGAAAAGRAIRRFGIGGSIGIDLPTLPDKAERQAAAAALDAALPQPFERTAVNGFGFLQVVRRRERPSIPELLRADLSGSAARALLRRAERVPGGGALTLIAAPGVAARLERESTWIEELARRAGGHVTLRADEHLPIFGGYVHQGTG
jgi:ribonuclease G